MFFYQKIICILKEKNKMQIFLPYIEPIKVAKTLDKRRLNKQIIECDWMLNAKDKNNRTVNHPIYKMYKNNLDFIYYYRQCLYFYKNNLFEESEYFNKLALSVCPYFLKNSQWYFDNFKSRLFTKDNDKYSIFSMYGLSYTNYYNIDGIWKKYEN